MQYQYSSWCIIDILCNGVTYKQFYLIWLVLLIQWIKFTFPEIEELFIFEIFPDRMNCD